MKRKVETANILHAIIIVASALTILAVLMPWARDVSFPPFLGGGQTLNGTTLQAGIYALISAAAALLFQLAAVASKRTKVAFGTLAAGLLSMFFSESWIMFPGYFETQTRFYTMLYGAHVALAGAAIVSTATGALILLPKKGATLQEQPPPSPL